MSYLSSMKHKSPMKQIVFTALLCIVAMHSQSQQAPNFTVTDSDGVVHRLYEDHLDQGKTVVIEMFFVNCPPCRSAAPMVQEKYVAWGAGEYDVEFIKLSTQSGDSNADVAGFKSTFGTTFPGVGADGGAAAARQPYQSGQFGTYFGTPSFFVIDPDRNVTGGFFLGALDDAITATGATGTGVVAPEPTTIRVTGGTASNSNPTVVTYLLTDAATGTTINISEVTNGSNEFEYPSAQFPMMQSPLITADIQGPAIDESVKPGDLFRMVRHILELEPFTNQAKLLAADVNGDGDVKAQDLLVLQRAILELTTGFNVPSWQALPSSLPLVEQPGGTTTATFQWVKSGDVTF